MIGRQIGPYEVVEKLGEGGMGVVYRARDTRLNRQVAFKCLGEGAPADSERRRRFLQEAQAASSLNHPGIVTVYDIANADGQDVIAMEYVRGTSLDKLLAPDGRPRALRLPEALTYAPNSVPRRGRGRRTRRWRAAALGNSAGSPRRLRRHHCSLV